MYLPLTQVLPMGQSCDFLHSWHRPGDAEIPTHHGSGMGQSVGRRQDRELLQVPRKQEWSVKKHPNTSATSQARPLL